MTNGRNGAAPATTVLRGDEARDAVTKAKEAAGCDDDNAARAPWPKLDPAALYGLAGDVVRAIEPHTEADPAGLLATFLTGFGNAVGRTSYAMADGSRHAGNLFLSLVGDTTTGRKGTSEKQAFSILSKAEEQWAKSRRMSGLSSGEGIIHVCRDPGDRPKKKDEQPDPGVVDKRLMAFESELSGTLKAGKRDGSTLTATLRDAWDGKTPLQTLTKTSGERASDVHMSLIGHVVPEELLKYLDESEISGGLGNRFLWVCVRRARELPDGGCIDWDAEQALVERVKRALRVAEAPRKLERDAAAAELWRAIYHDLTTGQPGLLGAMTARAAPQVLRLSLIYALLDEDNAIREPHLTAALAFWHYCEDSVRWIFGDKLGNPTAERILEALQKAGDIGMTRTELHKVFSNHVDKAEIGRALQMLESGGRATRRTIGTSGRPAERWCISSLEKQANVANDGHGTTFATTDGVRIVAKEGVDTDLSSREFAEGEMPRDLTLIDSPPLSPLSPTQTRTDTPAPGPVSTSKVFGNRSQVIV